MADIVFGIAGAAIAGIPGLGVTALQGFLLGNAVGQLLFGTGDSIESGRLQEIRFGSSAQGSAIPIAWGRVRVPGTFIWVSDLRESSEQRNVGGKGGQSVTEYSYFCDFAVLVCEGPSTNIRRIWAAGDDAPFYDNRTGTPVVADWIDVDQITVYLGSEAQTVDPLMAAALPAGECPAYRGFTYLVFENWPLTRQSNSMPQLSFEVENGTSVMLDDVLLGLTAMVDIDPALCDFSDVDDVPVRGLVIGQRSDANQTIAWLQQAYAFDLVDVDGTLKAVKRGGTPLAAISADELGLYGQESQIEVTRAQEVSLPRQVEVKYYRETNAFQQDVQSAQTQVAESDDTKTIEFPLTLTSTEAKRAAVRLLQVDWCGRMSIRFKTTLARLSLSPGDLIPIPTPIGNVTVRVTTCTLQDDGSLEWLAVEDDPSVYTQVADGMEGDTGDNDVPPAKAVQYLVRGDLHAFKTTEATKPRIYMWGGSMKTGWGGLKVYMNDYQSRHAWWSDGAPTILPSCTIGLTTTTMAAGLIGVWDDVTTVRVQLVGGALSSAASDLDVLNGTNMCLIGDEVIGFRYATLVGTNTYELSRLVRGMRGTEDKVAGTKAIGTVFTLYGSNMKQVTLDPDSFRYLSGDAPGDGYADDPFTVVYLGTTTPNELAWTNDTDGPIRAFSPCQYSLSIDGSNNRTISWTRRNHRLPGWVGTMAVPLEYDLERYAIAIAPSSATDLGGRILGYNSNYVLLGAVTGSSYPDLATALTTPSYTVSSATWSGFTFPIKIRVAQIGLLGYNTADEYRAFGETLTQTEPS